MASDSRAKDLFFDALDRDPADREAFVRQACGGDGELERQVFGLLRAHEDSDRFLQSSALPQAVPSRAVTALEALEVRPGDRIGNYAIRSILGEGGFGQVFLAEQLEPVQREVAFKVVKLGHDTTQVIARFEAERQVLARMDHPHIARVLDAGSTESGRPFFVIELVRGEPITLFCSTEKLGLRPRVELMRLTALAIQHAHGKGVLHRDVKPNNVLVARVDGEAQPRVIDFGVAKALEDEEADRTALTQEGHLVGTPVYMSPEQAGAAADVDARSDVYSLGVLLYELLAGRPPFEPESGTLSSLIALQQRIRETDATAPSVMAERAPGPGAVEEAIPKELDWIVLRALEKDRDRRFPTASALAEDLSRFLAGEPVESAPPSRTYRLRKWVFRHRMASTLAVAFLLALVLGMVGTTTGLVRASRANHRLGIASQEAKDQAELARQRADEAEQSSRATMAVNRFLTEDLLAAARPSSRSGMGRNVLMIDVLEAAAARLESESGPGGRFADSPTVEAQIRNAIGSSLFLLGSADRALEHFDRGYRLFEGYFGPEYPDTMLLRAGRGRALSSLGRVEEAELDLKAALAILSSHLGETDTFVLHARHDLCKTLWRLGRIREAYDETLALVALKEFSPEVPLESRVATYHLLGAIQTEMGDARGAEATFRRSLAELQAVGGEELSKVITQRLLAVNLVSQGRSEEALPILEAIRRPQEEFSGPLHPDTIAVLVNLGVAHLNLGELEQAEGFLREGEARLLQNGNAAQPDYLVVLDHLTRLHFARGDVDRAAEASRGAFDGTRETFGRAHPLVALRGMNLGVTLLYMNQDAEAREVFEQALVPFEDGESPVLSLHSSLLWRLAQAERRLGDREAARVRLGESLEVSRRALETAPEDAGLFEAFANAGSELYRVAETLGRLDESAAILVEMEALFAEHLGEDHERTAAVRRSLDEIRARLDAPR